MSNHEKRKSMGHLLPNIFFILQITISIIILYTAFLFDISLGLKYFISLIFCISIAYYLVQRKRVIARQKK